MVIKNNSLIALVVAVASITMHANAPKPATPSDANKKAATPSPVIKDINTNITVGDVVPAGKRAEVKVRYVNTMEAMQTCKKGVEKGKQLEKTQKELTNKIQAFKDKMIKKNSDLKAKESTMTVAARSAAEAELVKMNNEYEALLKSCETDLKIAMQAATEDLAVDVEKWVIQMAEKDGIDVVCDVYTGRTIYASKKSLMTDELIKNMDRDYSPGKTATA